MLKAIIILETVIIVVLGIIAVISYRRKKVAIETLCRLKGVLNITEAAARSGVAKLGDHDSKEYFLTTHNGLSVMQKIAAEQLNYIFSFSPHLHKLIKH